MEKIELTLYTFDELSEEAKEKALDELRTIEEDYIPERVSEDLSEYLSYTLDQEDLSVEGWRLFTQGSSVELSGNLFLAGLLKRYAKSFLANPFYCDNEDKKALLELARFELAKNLKLFSVCNGHYYNTNSVFYNETFENEYEIDLNEISHGTIERVEALLDKLFQNFINEELLDFAGESYEAYTGPEYLEEKANAHGSLFTETGELWSYHG